MNSRTTARAALLTLLATTPAWADDTTPPPKYGLSQTGSSYTYYDAADGSGSHTGTYFNSTNTSNTISALTGQTNAINVSGRYVYLDNYSTGTLTNTITGDITVSGGYVYLRNYSDGTLTNTITGDINVSGGYVYLDSSTNTINGSITVDNSGGVYLDSSTNTITGGITVSGGGLSLNNNGESTLTNTINGGITVSGGYVNLRNNGEGTLTNTVDAMTLNSGDVALGGYGSTTNIGAFNWGGWYALCALRPWRVWGYPY